MLEIANCQKEIGMIKKIAIDDKNREEQSVKLLFLNYSW